MRIGRGGKLGVATATSDRVAGEEGERGRRHGDVSRRRVGRTKGV